MMNNIINNINIDNLYNDIIYRIKNYISVKQLKVKINHINSHLLDTDNIPTNWDYKYNKVKEMFPHNHFLILKGNKEVDKLTKNPVYTYNAPIILTGTNQFILLDECNQIHQKKIHSVIMNKFKKQEYNNWINNTKGKTSKLLRQENIHQSLSLWPIKSKYKYKIKITHRFKHKLLTGLPTRNSMYKRLKNSNNFLKNIKSIKRKEIIKIKYQSDICILCNTDIENTEHLFSCKSNIIKYNEAAEKINIKYNELINDKNKKFPMWFEIDESLKLTIEESNEHTRMLTNFDTDLGNRSMIPKSLVNYVINYSNIPEDKQLDFIDYCAASVTKVAYKRWIRCKELQRSIQ